MDDKEKMLGMMKFWLFGTFIIIFASATVYIGMQTGTQILGQLNYWIAMGLAALLSVGAFFVYKWWINK